MQRVGAKRLPVIQREWFGLMPGRSLSFWVKVEREVRRQRVRRMDLDKVKAIAVGVARGAG